MPDQAAGRRRWPRTLAWTALAAAALVGVAVLTRPLWLPLPGVLLVEGQAFESADAVLVVDGSGIGVLEGAERWRADGRVRWVVVVEAPLRTHALVAYWSDYLAWGYAPRPPTPAEALRVVRSGGGSIASQTAAAAPTLAALGVERVVIPAGGLSSRVLLREARRGLAPHGIQAVVAPVGPPARDPAAWYTHPEDRRQVLTFWLQLLVPATIHDEGEDQ